MHLIWENLIPNLIHHWTGQFKGLDEGGEAYEIDKTCWNVIGEAMLWAGNTIPSVYGPCVPNISMDSSKFHKQCYYEHFVHLVRLLNICLQYNISNVESDEVESGFIQWVCNYERFYYQKDPARLATCPVMTHALLHIAEGICAMGPVWCYWAFPMERYCGKLQPVICSCCFPYGSLGHFVVEDAQLTQIKTVYDVADELSFQPIISMHAAYTHPAYPSCALLPPSMTKLPLGNQVTVLASALVTQKQNTKLLSIAHVKEMLKEAQITEWGKVKRIDSDEGDDHCDASFIWYELYIDKYTNQKKRQPEYELKTFYGQIEHLYSIKFMDAKALNRLNLTQDTVILAAIRPCVLGLDIHYYSCMGTLDIVDITTIQCLVGRVPLSNNKWAIIDRSRSLAHALSVQDNNVEAII
ncbi:hypothetical protein BDQ17DRAFT_1395011 [Cyathus striatus]|nr:hypothetical protein BDQ17DRAFT_1395011 [Cyathus striatus]